MPEVEFARLSAETPRAVAQNTEVNSYEADSEEISPAFQRSLNIFFSCVGIALFAGTIFMWYANAHDMFKFDAYRLSDGTISESGFIERFVAIGGTIVTFRIFLISAATLKDELNHP